MRCHIMINKFLRPASLRHANRLFSPVSECVKRGLKSSSKNAHSSSSKKQLGEIIGGLGLIGAFGIMARGYYVESGLRSACFVTGSRAPDALKNPDDPHRLVWSSSDSIEHGGPGDGGEGRSSPNEVSVVKHDKTIMRGYCKNPADGRSGFLNELIYHSLAKRVLSGEHPHIGLIETPINETESSYELIIESLGDNSNLLQHCKKLSKNPEQINDSSLKNLGCALAFSMLILSADNFLKNFVVMYQTNKQGFVYPIDFEKLDNSKERSHTIEYICSNKTPLDNMRSFIDRGALLDYKTSFTGGQRLRVESGAENGSDIGTGLINFGLYGRDILEFIIKNAAIDVENGNILAMYGRIASLNEDDVDDIINQFDFIMTDKEKSDYRHDLLKIVEKTQEYIAKCEQPSPVRP